MWHGRETLVYVARYMRVNRKPQRRPVQRRRKQAQHRNKKSSQTWCREHQRGDPKKTQQEQLTAWKFETNSRQEEKGKRNDPNRLVERKTHKKKREIETNMDGPTQKKQQLLHKCTGHIARPSTDPESSVALGTRSLHSWRDAQKTQVEVGSGAPKRFLCWRWDSQFRDFK